VNDKGLYPGFGVKTDVACGATQVGGAIEWSGEMFMGRQDDVNDEERILAGTLAMERKVVYGARERKVDPKFHG